MSVIETLEVVVRHVHNLFIIKTSERRQKRRSGVFIVNFEHFSQSNHCWVLLANVCWVVKLRLLM